MKQLNDETKYSPNQLIKIIRKNDMFIASRDVNEEFKYHYGFLDNDLISIVKKLKIEDYQKSETDKDFGGLLHFFKTNVQTSLGNVDCYIKLAIRKKRMIVAVISFHDWRYA